MMLDIAAVCLIADAVDYNCEYTCYSMEIYEKKKIWWFH